MRRGAVVPTRVKLRTAALSLVVGAASMTPWFFLPHAAALLTQLGMVGAGFGILWMLWPRLRLGIAKDLLGEVPSLATQRVRLSFDDGPTPGVTERVLDRLAGQGVYATFFVLLKKARANPQLIRRITSEGHTLALHGEDHRWPFFRSARALGDSLSRARSELEAIAGQPVTLYRPSHGFKTLALVRAVRSSGLRLCFWDLGVWDTDAPPVEVLTARLHATIPDAGEAPPVVLLHDGRGDEEGAPPHSEVLLAALEAWLPAVSARRDVELAVLGGLGAGEGGAFG